SDWGVGVEPRTPQNLISISVHQWQASPVCAETGDTFFLSFVRLQWHDWRTLSQLRGAMLKFDCSIVQLSPLESIFYSPLVPDSALSISYRRSKVGMTRFAANRSAFFDQSDLPRSFLEV